MARCEDYPCCGHEAGCCPDYDENGRQLNMKCVCGATVPLGSRSSLCHSCLMADDPEWPDHYDRRQEDSDLDDDQAFGNTYSED